MKYIKKFGLFEAVIMPSGINTGNFNDFNSLVEYGKKNEFDVVEYNEFYDSLNEADKKTAPPNNGRVPFFALFNPMRKKPMFVICVKSIIHMIPNFKEIVDDIIGHERVHASQNDRKKVISYVLPNPTIKKEYFSNKEEVMAFSWSIANDLFKISDNINRAFNELDKGRSQGQFRQIWNDIKGNCDEKIIKRYRKYIYMYLEKMFASKEVNKPTESKKPIELKDKKPIELKDKKSIESKPIESEVNTYKNITTDELKSKIKWTEDLFDRAMVNKDSVGAKKFNEILKKLTNELRNR